MSLFSRKDSVMTEPTVAGTDLLREAFASASEPSTH